MNRTMLAFSIGDVRLGLDAASMVEVLPNVRLVTPPETPPLLRGFLALGSQLVPVLRLEQLLATTEAESGERHVLTDRIIVARVRGAEVAWVAGAAMEPLAYRTRDLTPLPEGHVLNNCASHILPMQPPIIVLDADKLLLEGELARLAQLQARAAERLAMLAPATVPEEVAA